MIQGPMTMLSLTTRAALLRRLADVIDNASPLDGASFSDAITALVDAGAQTIDIARALKVATPTVTRWGQGATPHHLSRAVHCPRLAAFARSQADLLLAALPPLAEAA